MEKIRTKLKVATVVGTRPELIRLSVVIKKFDKYFNHVLIHTGQNYDYELNEIFFKELEIRKPDFFLNVPGENLGHTLGNVISSTYDIFEKIRPDAILVLGDTNSSLSIISAKRLKIPIFHMEAGNRCFDQNVPEEINRKIADHISDINLTYSENSRRYLLSEGFRKDHVFCVGSPLKEVFDFYEEKIKTSKILNKLDLEKQKYIVASIHREENLDINNNLESIIKSLNFISEKYDQQILFSTHPRTQKKLDGIEVKANDRIKFIKPLGLFDYISLQKNAFVVLSDSGSLTEEASILNFPAVSIRTTTERPEGIDSGSIVLGQINTESIVQSIEISTKSELAGIPLEYNLKNNSDKIARIIQSYTPIINKEIWNKSG